MSEKAVVPTEVVCEAQADGRAAPSPLLAPLKYEALAHYRQSMRQFASLYAALPVSTQATCPTCRKVVPATFLREGTQVVLAYACPSCAPRREVHHDAI